MPNTVSYKNFFYVSFILEVKIICLKKKKTLWHASKIKYHTRFIFMPIHYVYVCSDSHTFNDMPVTV